MNALKKHHVPFMWPCEFCTHSTHTPQKGFSDCQRASLLDMMTELFHPLNPMLPVYVSVEHILI